jgi:hypothetical protein
MELESSLPYSQQPCTGPYPEPDRSSLYHTIHFSKINLNIVTCISDSRRGFGLEIGFIDHFNTRLVITLNYSVIAYPHTSQITSAHAKSYLSLLSLPTSCFLVTASSSGNSSTAPTKSSLQRLTFQLSTNLVPCL